MVNTERLCMGCMNDNGGEKTCPICGFDSATDNSAQYLSIGTWLNANRYLVGKVIEETGDTAVYVAWDNDNNSVVNIIEYLPVGIARRSADRLSVSPNENGGAAFNKGLEEFRTLYEGLMKLNVSAVLPVVDFFESNGTLYAVQGTVSSITLKDFLIRNGSVLKWEQVKPWFMPLISAVNELHEAGIVHYGISPDTILVGRDGRLYLSGFSIKSARTANTDFTYKLANGYAAPEQYDVEAELTSACDVYALGAVLFRCVIGSTPPEAKDRLENDRLAIPANAAETISKGALVAIANALKIDPITRTVSADRLKKMVEAAVVSAPTGVPNAEKPKKKASTAKYAVLSAIITAVVCGALVIAIVLGLGLNKKDEETGDSSANTSYVEPVFPQTDIKYDDQGIEVPDWTGKTYSDVMKDVSDNSLELDVVIYGKVYSDKYAKGLVVEQTVHEGKVEPNSEIGIYISLGKSTLNMPSLIGLSPDEAKILLFEEGFASENIEFRERYLDGYSNVVTGCTVKAGESVSADEYIIVDYCPLNEELENSSDASIIE